MWLVKLNANELEEVFLDGKSKVIKQKKKHNQIGISKIMSIEDPYFVVRDDVAKAVDSCEKRVVEWRRIMEVKLLLFSIFS